MSGLYRRDYWCERLSLNKTATERKTDRKSLPVHDFLLTDGCLCCVLSSKYLTIQKKSSRVLWRCWQLQQTGWKWNRLITTDHCCARGYNAFQKYRPLQLETAAAIPPGLWARSFHSNDVHQTHSGGLLVVVGGGGDHSHWSFSHEDRSFCFRAQIPTFTLV